MSVTDRCVAMSVDHSVNLDTGNRWSSFKHLHKVLGHVVGAKGGGETSELESILRKHKPDFISLMTNPVSSLLFEYGVV